MRQTSGSTIALNLNNCTNRLLTVNGASVSHDANGNLTAYAGATYAWDVRRRLRTLVKGGATYTFGYNPAGLRTSKAVNGATTSFLLDGESIVSESTSSATTHLLQSPQVDQPLKRGERWFVPDKLGGTAPLTDGNDRRVRHTVVCGNQLPADSYRSDCE